MDEMVDMIAAFAFLASPVTVTVPNSVAACEAWLVTRHDSQARGETHSVPGGACFDGLIDDESAAGFVAIVGRSSRAVPPTVVIRSGGGDVDAGIAMARAVRRSEATVVVRNICLSSCANYVLASAARRIALPGALVGFHGGAVAMSPAEIVQEARATHQTINRGQAWRSSAHFAATVKRQATLIRDIGLKPDFFAWMARFNKLSEADRLRLCGGTTPSPTFLVFAPELLASKGYRFTDYAGPRSTEELAGLLVRYGLPKNFACYISAEHGRL